MKPEPKHVLVGDCGTYYESANSACSFMRRMPQVQFSHLEWLSYTWPGGYDIYYYVKNGSVLCHNCANDEIMRTIDPDDEQFYIVGGTCIGKDPPPSATTAVTILKLPTVIRGLRRKQNET